MKKPAVRRRSAYLTGLLMLVLGIPVIGPGLAAGAAEGGPAVEIIAPGGGDIDLKGERFSYFGRAGEPVIARMREFSVTARRIDYDRKRQELFAGGDVSLISGEINFRTEELLVDLAEESLTATGGFTLFAREMEVTGRVLTASLPGGVLTATGTVNWRFRDLQGKAEELTYRKDEGKVYLSGAPAAFWGENYTEGTMMVLHLETGKIMITGPVKSKLQPQGGGTGGD